MVLDNLGTSLLFLEDHEGIAMLNEALALDPWSVDVMVNVGLQCQDDGDLDRSRTLYLRQVGPSGPRRRSCYACRTREGRCAGSISG